MKKFYTALFALVATVLCAGATVNVTRLQKGALLKVPTEGNIVRKATSFEAAKPQLEAAATNAPATLDGRIFAFTSENPEYDDAGTIISYEPYSAVVSFGDPMPQDDGSISYLINGIGKGLYNSQVTLLDLEAYYYPDNGELELVGGSEFLKFQDETYTMWTLMESGGLSSVLPCIFVWNNDGFDFVPTYEYGTQTVTTTGFCNGIETPDGVGVVTEFMNPAFKSCDGVMNSTIYGWNKQANKQVVFSSEDPVYASVSGNVLTIKNWFGQGEDFAVDFTIDAAAKTLTNDATKTYTISNYVTVLAPATNDLGNATTQGDATKANGNLKATYTIDGENTTITVPDWNFFAKEYGYGALFYPITQTSINLTFDIEKAMSGINDVIADSDANAPVEFFNLQGARISNPAAGQLVIRRQGKTVTKVFVK